MTDLIITGNHIVDCYNDYYGPGTIYITGEHIEKFDKTFISKFTGFNQNTKIINAGELIVSPGLIDIHTHLREPGREDEETITSGCEAAVAGGFTAICCMPNTNPTIDSQEVVRFIRSRSTHAAARVFVIGAITKGIKGEQLSEIGDMVDAGIVGISDDGNCVMNAEIMRNGMEYAGMFHIPVISHAEDKNLSKNGKVNEGYNSTVLGIKGIPYIAEDVMVARDIALSRFTGTSLHIAHISTRGAVELVRNAKREGLEITAEATPHHFTLTDSLLKTFNTNLIVNPPLRTKDDVEAVREGIRDGTIDCIASDHAPHSPEEKDVEFIAAPFGMIGLETSLGVAMTELVHGGIISIKDLLKKMTVKPAEILNLPYNGFRNGAPADITIIDPDYQWVVDADKFKSKSRNSPFIGHKLKGKALYTISRGRIVYYDAER